MQCPFLRETRVSGCRSAHVRKLIPSGGPIPLDTACLTEKHKSCPGFVGVDALPPNPSGACPFLEESLAQFCAAAPVLKLIPYSESMLVRCGTPAYRYCDLYLEQAGPAAALAPDSGDWTVPATLLYTNRFWWIDLPDDGPWHAGLDAFAVRLTGPVERLCYLPGAQGSPPAVVLTVAGREYTFDFPEPLQVTSSNPLLRLHPERIWEAPYTRGWIYEGTATPEQRRGLRARLAGAEEARRRMEDDARLVNERLHQPASLMGDGGLFEPGLLARLDRDQARALMHALQSRVTTTQRN